MSLEAAILISCSSAITILGLLILLRNPKGNTNQLFAALGISLVGWTVFNYLSDITLAPGTSLIYTRLAFTWGAAAITSLMAFIAYFPNENILKKHTFFRLHLLWSTLMLPLTLSPLFISSVVSLPTPQIHTAVLYPVFIAYILYSLLLLPIFIYKQYKNTSSIMQKQQLTLLTWGISAYALLAITSSVVLPLFSNDWSSSKFAPISTLLLVGVFAYSIVKHKLFDIRLVVARSVAYSLLLFALSTLYSLGAFAVGGMLFSGYTSSVAQKIYDVVLALILVFTFQPLRKFFQKITDSIFYQDHYDPESMLNSLASIMAREIELQRLTDGVLNELTHQMRLSTASIIVLDNNQIFFEGSSQTAPKKYMETEDLKDLNHGLTVRDTLEPGSVPEVYIKHNIDVSVGLSSNNEFTGFLLLGAKKSGDIYNKTDIKALNILANELAVAIHNAKSYTQIQNFNKTLQVKIDEATSQLRDANEHLKELDEIKNEFLSMATHQLNTPLAAVDGYLSMMTDGIIADPKEQHETMEKLLHRVRMMKHLVTDFLNVSRLEAGTFVIEPTPVDLNKMVTEQVNELGPTAKEKAVFLQYIAPKHPLPLIEIDEEKISQAVMNLIDNAIYYTPKGTVKVYLDADEQNASFKVVDNGIGVPETQKAKLFQKFARADNARKERPNGNGVGLYLVKLVVEAHGGQIIFESTEGKGSTFGFSLPLKVKEDLNTKIQAPKPKEKEPVPA